MIKLLVALSMIFTAILLPAHTLAFDPFGPACNGNTSAAACQPGGADPLTGTDGNGLIINIANIIAFIAGGAAVILIIISAIRFITAGGDPEKAKSARSMLTGAVIGIIVIVLARTLIAYVVHHLHIT